MGAVDLDEAFRDRDERARFKMALDQAPPLERSRHCVFPSDISKAGHIEGISRERPARRRLNRRAGWRSNADSRDLAIDRLTCAGWRNPIPTHGAIRWSV